MKRDVYSGRLKLLGEEHVDTIIAANNYASSLAQLQRFEESRPLMRKALPAARRVLGESHQFTLTMTLTYAEALYRDNDATLDDLREAVGTLEDAGRIAQRVLGGAHPVTVEIEENLQDARAALRARETPSGSA